MKETLKKLGLLLSSLAVILFMTGCPSPETPVELTKYTVTVYAAENAEAKIFTVEEGDTLASIKDLPAPVLDGYTFAGWFTAEKVKIETSAPIKSNLTIYAKFEKTSTAGSTKTTETKTADGTKTVTVETTTTDESGITTTVTETTTTDKDGTESTQIDTDVKTSTEVTVDDLINLGIATLASDEPDITTAQAYFNAAYEKDPENDKTKVYSALSDIASIVTNSKIQQFFSDHLGITNYPSDLSTLIAGNWLSAKEYESEKSRQFSIYSAEEVTSPSSYTYYYYKAREIAPDSSEYSSAPHGYLYYKVTINGKEYYTSSKYDRDLLKDGQTRYLFGGNSHYYYSSYSAYKLDENGDCLVEMSASDAGNAKAYKLIYDNKPVPASYKVIWKAPVLKSLSDESWFTTQASNAMGIYYLLFANILNGNASGLDSIIDDLYSVLYESDEYKNACKKIDSIKGTVELSEKEIESFGLEEIFGKSTALVGATELKLIESVLNIYKGLLEYLQCYSFNTNLSFVKDSWSTILESIQAESEEESMEKMNALMQYAMSLIASYNATIDPIANGFLSVRNAKKMTASKNTFIGILTDLIAAYDSITGEDTIYPSAITETVVGGAGIREGVALLKAAITNGGQFYIPKAIFGGELPETWPTKAADSGLYTLDCGKLFTAGQFAIENLLDMGTVAGTASSSKVPYIYKVDAEGKLGAKITTAEDFASLFAEGDSEEAMVAIKVLAPQTLSEVIDLEFIPSDAMEIKIPAMFGAMIFQFYYGGLAELMDSAENSGN